MSFSGQWDLVLMIDGIDYSARLTGRVSIEAGEDEARTATLELVPTLAEQIDAFVGLALTIDVVIDGTTTRRFIGKVATSEFNPDTRVIDITARDAYQDTINKCTTAAEVGVLLGGHETASAKLVAWSDDKPSPGQYFEALRDTALGSYFISSQGVWTYRAWTIGAATHTFTAAQVLDESVKLTESERAYLPKSIKAKLTARLPRLWSAECRLLWAGLDYVLVGRGRGSWPSVQSIESALGGVSGWVIKGSPIYTHPNRAYVIPLEGGGNAALAIAYPETYAIAMDVTMYSRWSQQVDVVYSMTINIGGESDVDDSIAESISSDFDASSWESATPTEASANIFAWNAPAVVTPKTGYEALPQPWPPANGCQYHYPDIGVDGLAAAVRFVAAKAARTACSGRRRRGVQFECFAAPGVDIGAVVAMATSKVSARGQVTAFSDSFDFDSGDAISRFSLACPVGTTDATAVTVVVQQPSTTGLSIAVAAPALANHVGADTETPANPDPDALFGSFSNTGAGITGYDDTAPGYVTQFRVCLPEVAAEFRDGTTVDIAPTVAWTISGGDLEVTL